MHKNHYKPYLYISQNNPDDSETSKYKDEVKQILSGISRGNSEGTLNPLVVAIGIANPIFLLSMGLI